MRLRDNLPLHLTYCLNIHPGETWEENFDAIVEHAAAVRDMVAPDMPFGLGLRLSNIAAKSLAQRESLNSFKRFLADNNMYVFTVNGFSYGRFHGSAVKEKVYQPDWLAPERRAYTIALADILAALLPEDVAGSISTVPCSYKNRMRTDEDIMTATSNLMDCVAHLARIREMEGRTITLALEPEPDCFLETTGEAVAFFENYAFDRGAKHLASNIGCGADEARRIVCRHLGICFDTCHIAVQFEDICASVKQLRGHGIAISKIHLSAAVRARIAADTVQKLAELAEPSYLHQLRIRYADGKMESHEDISNEALNMLRPDQSGEMRCHFHLPLYFAGCGSLESTASALTPEFFRLVLAGETSHLEIETYTLGVLPAELRPRNVARSVAKEYDWVRERVRAAQVGPR